MSTLPPVLYWSASLAARLNANVGDDPRHGLIDFTAADWPTYWTGDGDFWARADGLLDDAVRLVAEVPTVETATEYGVRWPADASHGPDAEHDDRHEVHGTRDSATRVVAMYRSEGAELVQRDIRRGQWREVAEPDPAVVEADDQAVETVRERYSGRGPGRCGCGGNLPATTHTHSPASCVSQVSATARRWV